MIVCGWCGKPTTPERCSACGHIDPARPYVQRGEPVPTTDPNQHRLTEAEAALGPRATVDALAEYLSVDPRTVRRWRKSSADVRPVS